MNDSKVTVLPGYLKVMSILLLLILIIAVVYAAQSIIIPFAFALLAAVLMLPLNNWLEKKKVGRVYAITISLVLSSALIVLLVFFLTSQVTSFIQDIPAIKKQLMQHATVIQNWVVHQFNISKTQQENLLNSTAGNIGDGAIIGGAVLSVTELLSVLVLIPVYVFLLLYYRDMIYNFFLQVFDNAQSEKVKLVLRQSRHIVQGYMMGLLVELGIVAAINSAGFLIAGIQYAVFLGVFAALLNMIPYIGMLIATFFCALITLSTSSNITDVIAVVAILITVQFIDNNIIMPKVVSSKVKINALITILGVLAGGAIAGVAGMFLSIPAVAILKVVFDNTDGLHPWGMILGDDITGKRKPFVLRRQKAVAKKDAE
jgi:predicted PurR-regulated permease PerM